MRLWHKAILVIFALAVHPAARADIGLLLNAKTNAHPLPVTAEITGAGHSAVYLSRICPASPVTLRMCGPDEPGSVIQNYEDYMEDQPYEWNIVPLGLYLYGVEDLRDRPLFGSPELRSVLQDHYRQNHLGRLCATSRCLTNPEANWRDSVAAAFVREIYIFQVHTTVEQDEEFIRKFNARPNVNHYNGFSRNCADFAKLVVDTYFPHSAHRDVLNDLGMTGPKAIARSFAHYAERHPELGLRVVRVEQVPGTYKRSSDCREGTEQTVRSKKWLIPIAAVEAQALPVLAASYFLTGRFNPDHELRNRPSENSAVLVEDLAAAKQAGDRAQTRELQRELRAERLEQVGDKQQWQIYRDRFEEVLHTAIDDGIVSDRRELRNLFRNLQARGRVYLDGNGQPWLEAEDSGRLQRVGLTTGNIVSPESDSRLALQLLLARTEDLLSVKSKHRELSPEFQSDWALLQRAEEAMLPRGANSVIASRASRR
ncbi:MAG: hypothetical protein ABSD98_04295 [Candidatus Korobacteraceae bacterium]|jgi:hypothetical protein